MLSGIFKNFQKPFIQFIGLLTARVVVLNFEGFNVKELVKTCNNYTGTISFSPPHSIELLNSLILSEQKFYQWVLKHCHGLDWEREDYPNCNLQQILQSVVL